MLKLTILSAAVAALAHFAAADNCRNGYRYCGSSLIQKGNYQEQIQQALQAEGLPYGSNGARFLFKCVDDQGDIALIQACGTCADAGSGKDDYCR